MRITAEVKRLALGLPSKRKRIMLFKINNKE
jgi:hypothetical protein